MVSHDVFYLGLMQRDVQKRAEALTPYINSIAKNKCTVITPIESVIIY